MKIEITPQELADFIQRIQNQHIAIRPATIQVEDVAVPPWDEKCKENGCAVGTPNQIGGTAK